MIEIVAVVMMLILFVGAYLWREEARYRIILANKAEAELGLLRVHCDILETQHENQKNAIRKLMAHEFQFSVDWADIDIEPIEVCTKCFRIKQESD